MVKKYEVLTPSVDFFYKPKYYQLKNYSKGAEVPDKLRAKASYI